MTPLEQLADGMQRMGLPAREDVLQKLVAYAALLAKWNKTYNLTAVRDPERIVALHLLDSLAILPHVAGQALLDVGSGGGLPGIPLALCRPELQVTLLDSNSKKSAFQRQAVIELGLVNVGVVNMRVDGYVPPVRFSQIVSRAFSELADFVDLTRPLLVPGGRWLAMKGVYPEAEIDRLPAGIVVAEEYRLEVPGVDGERHLIVMRES
jgi:16S rRNA (guanine527-N7)-methyltransferase